MSAKIGKIKIPRSKFNKMKAHQKTSMINSLKTNNDVEEPVQNSVKQNYGL